MVLFFLVLILFTELKQACFSKVFYMGLGLWSLSVIYIFKTDNISKNDKPAATAVIKAQCAEPAVCKHGVLVSVLKADS